LTRQQLQQPTRLTSKRVEEEMCRFTWEEYLYKYRN